MDYIYISGEQKIVIEVEQKNIRQSVIEQYVRCRKVQGMTQAELNLESHNAQMIKEGKEKEERFKILQEIAEYQSNVLNTAEQIKKVEICDNDVISIPPSL